MFAESDILGGVVSLIAVASFVFRYTQHFSKPLAANRVAVSFISSVSKKNSHHALTI
jgi:hypothetical protein